MKYFIPLFLISFVSFANGPGTRGLGPPTPLDANNNTHIWGRTQDPDYQERIREKEKMEEKYDPKKELKEKEGRKKPQSK